MQDRWKAIAVLVLTAPVLTEIVSGNTPPHALLHPSIDAFLIAVYSLPLLLIRELSIRWRLSNAGLFPLGLAYGLLNEGLVAQTLIRDEHVPVANFDHYVYAAGINFSWAALIVPWHALMAVLFPIALLGLWFPGSARSRWLGRQAFVALAMVVAGGVVFLGLARRPRFPMHVFLLSMIALVACAWMFRGGSAVESGRGRPRQAFVTGACFYIALFFGATLLAGRRAPATVYFFFVGLVILGFGWLARRSEIERPPDVALVALGAYFVASIFNGLAGFLHHSREAVVCGAVLSLAFLWLWRTATRRKPAPDMAATEAKF